MFDPNNVVEVYQPNELPTEVRGQVVFYDLDFVDFTPAHWVMGGQAFIVKKGNQLVLISRGGLRFDFALASEQTFLGMTPNGWLMGDDVEGRIFHYHYTSDQFVIDEIADLQGPFRQMGGVNTASYGLLDFVKTIPVPDVVFCPGSMPSNLTVGNDAEVIVHNPEVAPFLQFMILDENGEWNGDFVALPLGATIHIVAGPHCDDPGPLYWTAEYDGMIGEIAEMYLTSYILRPLD
jgi:hypothetical protein